MPSSFHEPLIFIVGSCAGASNTIVCADQVDPERSVPLIVAWILNFVGLTGTVFESRYPYVGISSHVCALSSMLAFRFTVGCSKVVDATDSCKPLRAVTFRFHRFPVVDKPHHNFADCVDRTLKTCKSAHSRFGNRWLSARSPS